jgi:nucleotide-binding universal stress UspA family protein
MRFQRVLVAIDSSEFAVHALEVASALATALNGQIGLVHVIDPKLVGSETGVPADQIWAMLRADG